MSSNISSKISFALNQIIKGNVLTVLKGLGKKIKSEKVLIGQKLDLTKELKKPRSFLKVSIRLYKDEDAIFFNEDNENTTLIKNLQKCYVAITEDGEPCFRQWILDASQNKKIKEFWGDSYPILKKDEALFESAFAIPKVRGMGVMPVALNQIAQEAKSNGIKSIQTYTPLSNINSIRALNYAGFRPFCIQKETFFLFKKTVSYDELTQKMEDKYKEITQRRRGKRKKS